MSLAHYSPEDVSVIIGGVHQVDGFIDGTFINVSKDTPSFLTRVTASGMVSRVKSPNPIYTVNLTIHHASESNDVLSRMVLADEVTKMVKVPLIIKDQKGTSLLFALSSWIESRPSSSFSDEVEEREWVIKCNQVSWHVGNNYEESSDGEDVMNTILGQAANLF